MKTRIEQLLTDYGLKHFSKQISKDPELVNFLITETSFLDSAVSISERVWCYLNNFNPFCDISQKSRKFKSFSQGYGFCGKTGQCACAKKSVSSSVQKTKSSYSDETKQSINQKRVATCLDRYGVTNSGQTLQARERHREFYSDSDNIKRTLEKYKATIQERYGVDNPYHSDTCNRKKLITLREKYDVSNPMQVPEFAKKSARSRCESDWLVGVLQQNYNRLVERFSSDYGLICLTGSDEYLGVKHTKSIRVECQQCGFQFDTRLDHGFVPRCLSCHPRNNHYKSREELLLFDFVKTDLGISTVISGDRSLINPYEIDILCPDQKIAIEYGGLYWHSELQGKNKKYHLDKLNKLQDKGYRLITIFSDEWNLKREIVKSKLGSLFGKSHVRSYARTLTLVELDPSVSKSFLRMNHLQGGNSGTVNLGLYSGNELLCVATFGPLRVALNSKVKDGVWELIRLSSLMNHTIVGGASKLLSYFIKTRNPVQIISYADRRWSNGNVYEQLGFRLTNIVPPGYHYTNDYIVRKHRYQFRKSVLVEKGADPMLTEWEIMQLLGYDRIWDCGMLRYVWSR